MKEFYQVTALVVLISVLLFIYIKDPFKEPTLPGTTAKPPPQNFQRPGYFGVLSAPGKFIPLFIDEETLTEYLKAYSIGDKWGMSNLEAIEFLMPVLPNTKVLVLEQRMGKLKVRVLEGRWIGRSGWVPIEFVK